MIRGTNEKEIRNLLLRLKTPMDRFVRNGENTQKIGSYDSMPLPSIPKYAPGYNQKRQIIEKHPHSFLKLLLKKIKTYLQSP